ncbi:MAG: helix-turn-helix domain-containing protein [Bacteroidales bacterium]|nr:helix-turn-helix domain-containing protein [Candidatus Colicola equi]
MKHSIEERRLAVKLCLSGMPPKTVGRKLGIDETYVSIWLTRYNMFGSRGLHKIPHKQLHICKIGSWDKTIPLCSTNRLKHFTT